MLQLPNVGFSRSVTRNNVNRTVLGDWLEASALFVETFSKSDAADILTEEGVTDSQDLARDIIDEGWLELEGRFRASGPSTCVRLVADRLENTGNWQLDPVRSFLVLLSIFEAYPKWSRPYRGTNQQGVLFEAISATACERIFRDWNVFRAGWSPTGGKDIPAIIRDLSDLLGTAGHPDPAAWAGRSANDAGLDLMCFRNFPDPREGVPILAVQCASGGNWTNKLTEPSTNLWQKLLDSAFEPTRVLAIPFIVDKEELARRCVVIEGPLFDRNRLLSVGSGSAAWIDPALAAQIIAWLDPIAAVLPVA